MEPASPETAGNSASRIDDRQAQRVARQNDSRGQPGGFAAGAQGATKNEAEAAQLARNDRGSFFAAIGFETQKLAQDQEDNATKPEVEQRQAQDAAQAYQAAAQTAGAKPGSGREEVLSGFFDGQEQSRGVDITT
jgi:hypothetical protein